jgi:hypothetical protein
VCKEVENAENFMNHITGLTAELRLLSDNITDAEVVRKMLQVVPDHLTQVMISIKTLLDIKSNTIEEVTGMLHAIEQQCKPTVAHNNQGRLLLYEEEWMARLKLRESVVNNANNNSSNSSNKKHGGHGHGRARDSGKGSSSGS